MTDEKTHALLERIAVLLVGIDNRVGRIERALVPPVYKLAADGVLTRVSSPSQITEGSLPASNVRAFDRWRP